MNGKEIAKHINHFVVNNDITADEAPLYVGSPGQYDDAIIGFDSNSCRVIYSQSRLLHLITAEFMKDEGCEDPSLTALEWYEFNIAGAYVGERTPIYCCFDVTMSSDDVE